MIRLVTAIISQKIEKLDASSFPVSAASVA